MQFFFQGFLMGLAYVAPIGTQNLFMINTALTTSKKRTLLTALIIAFFDITLSFACFYGIGILMSRYELVSKIVLAIGSIVVIWIGIGLLRSKATFSKVDVDLPLFKVIATACVVTWFNPQAIIDGTMLLGSFKASIPAGLDQFFIYGVMTASLTWWLTLSTVVGFLKQAMNDKILRAINIVSGCIIVYYGVKLLISFIKQVM
ncbi:LysE/ArgO family amino acid transporter [Guggenheimella bovis]